MRLAAADKYGFLRINEYVINQVEQAYSKIDTQAVKNGRDLAVTCLYRKMWLQI